MTSTVRIVVTEGPLPEKELTVNQHDVLIFGRGPDCRLSVPEDRSASRHHFALEINPPRVRLRDLGSLGGTYVNGRKVGGRAPDESPEAAARRPYAQVDISDGDEIRAGRSVLRVHVTPLPPPAPPPAPPRDPSPPRLFPRLVARVGALRTAAPAVPAASPGAGREIAGHQIERLLDRGGFGAVYLAREPGTGEHVAIKVMLAHTAVDESSRRRFTREIEIMRSLRHPNVVALRQGGAVGDFFFYTMEYCSGGSLADRLRQRGGALSLDEAAPIMLDVLAGLAAAHAAGFVHRDVKPSNLLLAGVDRTAACKIGDLGLSKRFVSAELNGLTATGMRGGDAYFMPREQLVSFRDTRPVSDVWAAGATFYVLLTGRNPRQPAGGPGGTGGRPLDPLRLVLEGHVVPILEVAPHLPIRVAAVIDRALSPGVDARFQSAGEMHRALADALAFSGVLGRDQRIERPPEFVQEAHPPAPSAL